MPSLRQEPCQFYKRMGKDAPETILPEFSAAYLELIKITGKIPAGRKSHLADPSGMWRADATVLDALPSYPVPDDAPATSFWANGELIVVLNTALVPHIVAPDVVSERDEAILHELYEVLYLQQLCLVEGFFHKLNTVSPKLLRAAHIASSARLIKEFSRGYLLPLHRRDLQMLTSAEAKDLFEEDRSEPHALLGQYFPDLVNQLVDYELKLVKPALAKLVNVSTKPIVQLSGHPARKHPPHP